MEVRGGVLSENDKGNVILRDRNRKTRRKKYEFNNAVSSLDEM